MEENTAQNEKFVCDICQEEFSSIVELTEHKLTHERPFIPTEEPQSIIRGDIGAAGLPTSPTR